MIRPVAPWCQNCERDVELQDYAISIVNNFVTTKQLCKDCWVIKYGEGKRIEERESGEAEENRRLYEYLNGASIDANRDGFTIDNANYAEPRTIRDYESEYDEAILRAHLSETAREGLERLEGRLMPYYPGSIQRTNVLLEAQERQSMVHRTFPQNP